jgi:hypothetical protein
VIRQNNKRFLTLFQRRLDSSVATAIRSHLEDAVLAASQLPQACRRKARGKASRAFNSRWARSCIKMPFLNEKGRSMRAAGGFVILICHPQGRSLRFRGVIRLPLVSRRGIFIRSLAYGIRPNAGG